MSYCKIAMLLILSNLICQEFVEESLEAKKKEAKNGTTTVDDSDIDGSGDENTTDSTTGKNGTTTDEGVLLEASRSLVASLIKSTN